MTIVPFIYYQIPIQYFCVWFSCFFFVFQNAEEHLRKEANLADLPDSVSDSDVSSVLAAYKSEGDPELYEYAYLELTRFVEESLDIYKVSSRCDSFEYSIANCDFAWI